MSRPGCACIKHCWWWLLRGFVLEVAVSFALILVAFATVPVCVGPSFLTVWFMFPFSVTALKCAAVFLGSKDAIGSPVATFEPDGHFCALLLGLMLSSAVVVAWYVALCIATVFHEEAGPLLIFYVAAQWSVLSNITLILASLSFIGLVVLSGKMFRHREQHMSDTEHQVRDFNPTLPVSVSLDSDPPRCLGCLTRRTFTCNALATVNGTTCVICLQVFQSDDLLNELMCGHLFHAVCIDSWLIRSLNHSCPLRCLMPKE